MDSKNSRMIKQTTPAVPCSEAMSNETTTAHTAYIPRRKGAATTDRRAVPMKRATVKVIRL